MFASRLFLFVLLILNTFFCIGQKQVVIDGHCRICGAQNITLILLEDPILLKENHIISKIEDDRFLIKTQILKPQFARLNNQSIYISPGDSIVLSIDTLNKQGYFEGKNAIHYNMITELRAFRKKASLNSVKYDSSSGEYRDKFFKKLELSRGFLRERLASNSHSKPFENFVVRYNEVLFFSDLIYDISDSNGTLADLRKYLDYFPKDILSDSSLLVTREYNLLLAKYTKMVANSANRNLFGLSKYLSTIDELYVGPVNFAQKIFFIEQALTGGEENKQYISSVYEDILSQAAGFGYDTHLFMGRINNYLKLNQELPVEILALPLSKPDNSMISIDTLLNQIKTDIVYIDFWATWCGPCVQEMPEANRLEKELVGRVTFVYLSIDTKSNEWVKELRKRKIFENHYRVDSKAKTQLMKYFDFNSIPRYVILKNKRLHSIDAPRPSNGEQLKRIINSL